MEAASWQAGLLYEANEPPIETDRLEGAAEGRTEHQPMILIRLSQQQPFLGLSGFVPLQFLNNISGNRDGPPRLSGLGFLKDQLRFFAILTHAMNSDAGQRLTNLYQPLLEINILPPKGQQLATPYPCAKPQENRWK